METQVNSQKKQSWQKILMSVVLVFTVAVVTFAVASKLNTQKSVSLSAPDSTPLACEEKCPDDRGVLLSCTPPDGDGTPRESGCLWKGRTETCGGKQYCCPSANGTWTKDMSKCCVDTTWTPDPALTCLGTKVTQTSNCGTTKQVNGTKIDGSCAVCTDTTWTPDPSTVCKGVSFTQTSNCGKTQNATGTKTDGTCVTCTDTTWTPATNTVCSNKTFTQTSNCGRTREFSGTKTDTAWTPATNTTCTTEDLNQTGDCGGTRTVKGSKTCCVDSTWSPSPSKYCSDQTFTQTSNCGNTKEIDGTKTCTPNISILNKVYKDDTSNKAGVYKTDQQISKISRDQMMVYTVDLRNSGDGSAKDVKVTDTLTGQNQTLLSFVDSESKCDFDFPTKRLTCIIEKIVAGGSEKLKFRVKVAQTALNGKVIRNTSKVAYGTKSKESSVDVLVSSVVTCNEFCNNDSECSVGLACDVFSNKCRRPKCTKEVSCNCVTPTTTLTTTPTSTPKPTATITGVDFPDSSNITPTNEDLAEETSITPTEELTYLPETGIFDLPQTAFFGGGLVLAIIGLFLAL